MKTITRELIGHNGEYEYHGLGINGKMSELNAAMGLTVLPYFKEIVSNRKTIVNYYNENLDKSFVKTIKLRATTVWNFSYFPILFNSEKSLLNTIDRLNTLNIFPRRYFYPLLSKLPYVDYNFLYNAENISNNVLCLPLYHSLGISNVTEICNLINNK
ncbi:MAG: DegT/DnrJ/EryC1/StrS family aminotransferase [Flavobacteriales bacterium]|nr:DegT/DnrJ/EryC1/StrS family aminotransferase [Flavobacteriales bacterium]